MANRESNQVEVFSPMGTSLLIFGTKGTGSGQFHFPQGIAFDPTNGSLVVDDSGNDRIERFTMSAGDASAAWTATYGKKGAASSTAPAGVLNQPTGVAVAPDGTIWVADTGNNRIVSMDTLGNVIFSATAASMGIPAAPMSAAMTRSRSRSAGRPSTSPTSGTTACLH